MAITGEHCCTPPIGASAADSVVIWTDGELTYRLEASARSTS